MHGGRIKKKESNNNNNERRKKMVVVGNFALVRCLLGLVFFRYHKHTGLPHPQIHTHRTMLSLKLLPKEIPNAFLFLNISLGRKIHSNKDEHEMNCFNLLLLFDILNSPMQRAFVISY